MLRISRRKLVLAVSGGLAAILAPAAVAQQPGWQPTRVPNNPHAQHISNASLPAPTQEVYGHATNIRPSSAASHGQAMNAAPVNSGLRSSHVASTNTQRQQSPASTASGEQFAEPGMVLRWKSRQSTPAPTEAQNSGAEATQVSNYAPQPNQHASAIQSQAMPPQGTFDNSIQHEVFDENPLRFRDQRASGNGHRSPVQAANYQADPQGGFQGGNSSPFGDSPFGNAPEVTAPQLNMPQMDFPSEPGRQRIPGTQGGQVNPNFDSLPAAPSGSMQDGLPPMVDPLDEPEIAPGPGGMGDDSTRANPFSDDEDISPRDDAMDLPRPRQPEIVPAPEDEDREYDLPESDDKFDSTACNELRERVRARPITSVNLDVSPAYGEGLSAVRGETEEQRLEFASASPVRDWNDYRGNFVVTGRLIDLRNDRVVLDVNGSERTIPIIDLSDADITYVGESWNIPLRCGTGDEAYDGRQFVPSSMRWTAPGHCHKPLYFEHIQLERYGHTVGPILQPLISTAHFFGNIAVLPYKMGIHPPNECQYSLGYFRPGNCAPYMVQPVPLSLRGAAVQAGFVTGAGALIP